jgi:hypothetical protein
MDGDEAELIELFNATKGPNETLQQRLESVHLLGSPGGPGGQKDGVDANDETDPASSSGGATTASFVSPTRRKPRNVVFTGPPEMISSAEEARAFNLRSGLIPPFSDS